MTEIKVYYLDPNNNASSFMSQTGTSADILNGVLVVNYLDEDNLKIKRKLIIPITRIIEIRTKEIEE